MDGCRAATPPASQGSGWPAGGSELDDEELDVFTAERYFNDALAAEDAFWCDRSSSSFSYVFKTAPHEGSAATPTAATSSSEASWNSRSALLPSQSALAAVPAVEAKPNTNTASDHAGRNSQSSSHLRRWLLGVAGCACACGDDEESASVSADLSRDEEAAGSLRGDKHTAVEDATTVRVMPGKWANNGDVLFAGTSGESSMRVLNPTTKASFDEHRRGSCGMFSPAPAGQGSTLFPAKESSSFTIVAGITARGGGAAPARARSPEAPGRECGSRRDSDEAAPSELDCMYPPSEASVVWSVVTAEGAASGNFSSAASGYYCNNFNGDEEVWRRHTSAGGKSSRRSSRSRISGSGMLMGCISRSAADAIGPPWT